MNANQISTLAFLVFIIVLPMVLYSAIRTEPLPSFDVDCYGGARYQAMSDNLPTCSDLARAELQRRSEAKKAPTK